jgi:hypothetical protein
VLLRSPNCRIEKKIKFSKTICIKHFYGLQNAMPWLRHLGIGLSPQKTGFHPKTVHVGL